MDRLLEEATLRRVGLALVPTEVRSAKAVEVLSRATAASDRQLRFCKALVEAGREW